LHRTALESYAQATRDENSVTDFCGNEARGCGRRQDIEPPDQRHPRLLRAGRERPSSGGAAENFYELSASHAITSSAPVEMRALMALAVQAFGFFGL